METYIHKMVADHRVTHSYTAEIASVPELHFLEDIGRKAPTWPGVFLSGRGERMRIPTTQHVPGPVI